MSFDKTLKYHIPNNITWITMKTYLSIWLHSEGERPSKVNDKLQNFGFVPIKGAYDYVYKWDKEASIEEVLNIGDQIQGELSGDKVLFELETVRE